MKRKLFLLLCALLTMIGVQAQVDVTDTYITNADFSSTEGWTQTHSSQYWSMGNGLIGTYAVDNNKTSTTDANHLATEYCFGMQCRWSTNYAQFTQTATLPAGNYVLAYDVENTNSSTTFSNSYDNRFYVQVGETRYADTSVEWMMGQRGWTQHIISFSLDSESSVTISFGYGTGENNYGSGNTPHLYVSHLELIYSASNPLDYTSKIANNSFESGDTGWTHGSSSDTGVKDNSGNYATTGTDGSKLFNTWWQGVPITQEITEIPNGKYVIKASLASSDANVDAKLFLLGPTANEHSDVVTIYKGTSGVFHDYAYEVLVTSKKITIGAVGGTDAGEYVSGGHWWYKADNFRLYYLGEDLSMYQVPLETAQAYAKGIDQETPMKASVLTALQSAITAYGNKAWNTFESSDDIIEAIDALNGAADNATASISNYEKAAGIINAASGLDAAGQASYAANVTVSAIKTAYDARTLEAVTSGQESACHTALVTATKAQTTAGSDWTAVITNPSFEENTAAFAEPIGWTLSGTAAGIQTQNNSGFDGYKVGTMFGERWSNSTIGDFDAYQTIEGMPSGVYELKAVATFNGTGGYLYANDIKTNVTEAKYYTVQVALDANSTLTVGVKNETSGNGSWFKCDDFTLKLVSAGLPDVEAVTGKMNATVASTQASAIAAYEADKTVANYNAASAAIAAAQASKDAYTVANDAITKAEDLQTANNFVTSEAATTFAEAIAAIKTPYTNGTLTDENATAAGRTLGVVAVGWHAEATNTPASNYIGSTWPNTYTINDWSVEGENDGSNYVVPFFQNWTNDGNSLGTTTMAGTLTGLSAGIYKVSAWVRVRAKDGVAATNATGITMDVNGGTAVDVTEGTQVGETQFQLKVYEATGIVSEDGNLTVNFNIAVGNNISWLSYKDISYTRLGDASVSATIGSTGWTTFASPYALDLGGMSASEGTVKAYYASSVGTGKIVMTPTSEGVAAGTGLMLKGTAGATVTIPVAASGSPIDGNMLVGCTESTPLTTNANHYVLVNNGGTAEFQSLKTNGATIPAGKAYLNVPSGGARLTIALDEEDPTAINAVEAVEAEAGALKDGKYLIGNKIVLVKNGVKYSANGQKLN